MINNRKRVVLVVPLILAICAATIFILSGHAGGASNIADAKLFDRSVTAIERNYLDPDRIDPRKMLSGALNQMQRLIPEILVKEKDDGSIAVEVGLAEKRFRTGMIGSNSDLKKAMREILSFVAENYHGETPPEEIEYAAIDGMLELLDPHSNFMSPKVYNEFQIGTRGKFGGLGIVISVKDGNLTVIAPIEGSPASRAGMRAGDRILQIGDESTINMSLTDAVNKLRGDVGSKVAIVVDRQGRAPRKIALTRAVINIDSVQHRLLAENGKRIGYLKLKSFQSNTDEDTGAALKDFQQGGAKLDGLILDLRNNPGGLLNIAVDLAARFLSSGTVVTTVGPRGEVLEKENVRRAGSEVNYPIVVLVNEGSASASEIVAGALQANNRAPVMGRRTFGKGSVQTLFELGEGSALKLTIAEYKPAGTKNIQLVGVTPDIDLQPATVDAKAADLVEDMLPSELDLEQHLGGHSSSEAKSSSQYHVRYLQPKEKEQGDEKGKEKAKEEQVAKEYAKEPAIEKDFAVTLARRLLAASGKNSREALLSDARETVKQAGEEQEQKINEALSLVGVDWALSKANGEPRLTLAYHLRKGKAEIARARAGDKIDLVLTATNAGTGTYSKLVAVGQSDTPFLANREFPFGRLAPGATKSWNLPIEIPEALPRQDLAMDVSFEEGNGNLPKPLTVIIPIDELPEPSFSFTMNLSSDAKGKPLPKGSPIAFSVDVTNQGSGATSPDTFTTVSNDCGEKFFIEKGRVKIGALSPKATKHASFQFHLAPDFAKETCSIKLTIADMKKYQILSKKIELLTNSSELKPPAGADYQAPAIEISKAPQSTAETKATISGTIRDVDPIRDYFVYVGDKKVAYAPNPEEKQSMSFDVTIPLEPGYNQIAIGARDKQDLLSRKYLVIERTSGERKKKDRTRDMTFVPNMQP
ncbi:MAG: MXAN_5808 family serine peptidase [Pseudomonadota bacterium]